NAVLEYNWIARAQNYEGDMMPSDPPGPQSLMLRGNVILGNANPENHSLFIALSNDTGTAGYSFDLTAIWNTMVVATPTNPALVTVVNDQLDMASVTLSNNIVAGTNAVTLVNTPTMMNTTISGTNNWLQMGTDPGTLAASILGASPGFSNAGGMDF